METSASSGGTAGLLYCPRPPRWIVRAVRAISVAGWGAETVYQSVGRENSNDIVGDNSSWRRSNGGRPLGALSTTPVGFSGGGMTSRESFTWTLGGWRRAVREAMEREDARQLRAAFDREEASGGYDAPASAAAAATRTAVGAAPVERASYASTMSLTARSPWALVGALASWLEDRFYPLFGAEEAEALMSAAEGELPPDVALSDNGVAEEAVAATAPATAAPVRPARNTLWRHGAAVRDKRLHALSYVLDQLVDPFCRAVLSSFAAAATDNAATLLGPLLFLCGHAYGGSREEALSGDDDQLLLDEDTANMPRAIAALSTLAEMYAELFSSSSHILPGNGVPRSTSTGMLPYSGSGSALPAMVGLPSTASRGSLSDASEPPASAGSVPVPPSQPPTMATLRREESAARLAVRGDASSTASSPHPIGSLLPPTREPLWEQALQRIEALEQETEFLRHELASFRDECVSGNRELHSCVDAWTAIVLSETRSVAASERAMIKTLSRRVRKLERQVLGAVGESTTSPENSVTGRTVPLRRTGSPERSALATATEVPPASQLPQPLYSELSSEDTVEPAPTAGATAPASRPPRGALPRRDSVSDSLGSDDDSLLAAFQRAVGLGVGSGDDTSGSTPPTPQAGNGGGGGALTMQRFGSPQAMMSALSVPTAAPSDAAGARRPLRRIMRDGKWLIEPVAERGGQRGAAVAGSPTFTSSPAASAVAPSSARASRREREAVLRRQIESMQAALDEERHRRRALEERLTRE